MAVEKTIVIKGDTSDAVKSFEELSAVIQEQTDITIEFERELEKLEQQLKDTPKGSLAAQKELKTRITGLKDALGDQRVALKGLNNERKKASKINKQTFEDVTKNGGAIALLDTVTGGMASRTRDAFEATKLFNLSLKGTRTALIATGIGAFVVALGAVVVFWDDIVELITGANKLLQKQINLGKERAKDLSFELEILELQRTTLENLGKSTEKIDKDIKATLETQLLQAETQLELLQTQLKIEDSKVFELSVWNKIQVAAGGVLGTVELISEEEQKRRRELRDGVNEQLKSIEQIRQKQSQAIKEDREERQAAFDERLEQNTAELEAFNDLRIKTKDDSLTIFSEEIEERLKLQKEGNDAQLAEDLRLQLQTRTNARETAEFQKALDNAVFNAKLNIANTTSALIGQLVERDSALGKGVAVAQATISGFQGAQNAFTTAAASPIATVFPAYPFIQAGLAAAFSAVQIKEILSTDPSGRGGARTPSRGGTGGAAAPNFNLVAGTGANQIAEGLAGQNQPLKAFVVASDVSSQQSLDRNIVSNSSL